MFFSLIYVFLYGLQTAIANIQTICSKHNVDSIIKYSQYSFNFAL